jgi:hypothetical protein
MQNRNLLTPPHMCVYKIEKFRTLSATSEIASQFSPPLRSNKILKLKKKSNFKLSLKFKILKIFKKKSIFQFFRNFLATIFFLSKNHTNPKLYGEHSI